MANTYRSQQERSGQRAHSSTVHIVLRTALSLSLETQNLEPMTFDCLVCNLVLGTISVIRHNILLSPNKNAFLAILFSPFILNDFGSSSFLKCGFELTSELTC